MTLAPAMDRIAKILALALSSDHDGEVVASIRKLKVVMAGAGIDHHDIVRLLSGHVPHGIRMNRSGPPPTIGEVTTLIIRRRHLVYAWEYQLAEEVARDLALGRAIDLHRSTKLRSAWERIKGE